MRTVRGMSPSPAPAVIMSHRLRCRLETVTAVVMVGGAIGVIRSHQGPASAKRMRLRGVGVGRNLPAIVQRRFAPFRSIFERPPRASY